MRSRAKTITIAFVFLWLLIERELIEQLDNQFRNINAVLPNRQNGFGFPGHPVHIPQVAIKLSSIMLPCRFTQALSLLTQRRTVQRLPSGRICCENGQYQHTWKYLSEFFGYFAQASMPGEWVMYNIFKKYTWKKNTRKKNQNIKKKVLLFCPERQNSCFRCLSLFLQ